MIYLDYAATSPIHPKALEMYSAVAADYFGNASSLHGAGTTASNIEEAGRKTIAETLNARPKDVYFTSGATESNHLAIRALLDGCGRDGKHIICGAIEHASVIDVFKKLETEGYELGFAPVNSEGIIEPETIRKMMKPETVLVSIQMVNSEIGSIQPVAEIGALLREHDILFHTDAVQAFGKIPVDVQKLNADALTISAHKIYGPKGIGAVWIDPRTSWKPYFSTEGKKNIKTGTVNVPGIAAFSTAAKIAGQRRDSEFERIRLLRKGFISKLKALPHDVVIEGAGAEQSPYILGVRFPGMEGQFFMLECDQAGLAISTGSACQVGSEKPNRTMKVLGYSDEQAREFVRFSFGENVKEHQLDEIIRKIYTILTRHFNKVNRTKSGS